MRSRSFGGICAIVNSQARSSDVNIPIAGYIADFACARGNELVIELDGGQHADEQDQDEERTLG